MVETTHEALLRQTATAEELLAYFQGQRDQFQADVGQAQADYAALGNDLIGIVGQQMAFTGTVNPDEANPTNIDGGTFTSLRALINAAPCGAYVRAALADDKIHEIEENITIIGKAVEVARAGGGAARPILTPRALVSGGVNQTKRFTQPMGGVLVFSSIDIVMPPKVDAALPWNSFYNVLVDSSLAPAASVRLNGSNFSGQDGAGVVTCNRGTHVNLSVYNATLDGAVVGVLHVGGWGTAIISTQGMTLANGAVAHSGGTLGTDLLMN